MRNSPAKRARILQAAAELFIEHGVEGTTLAMVAKATAAAIGSITHFFGGKRQLAAAVLEGVAKPLIANADAALRGHGANVSTAITALLSVCATWAEAYPHHRRLIAVLGACTPKPDQILMEGIEPRLARVLAIWAEPLIQKNRVERLSPAQLYAVILAPMMTIAFATEPQTGSGESPADWVQILSRAALSAISPPVRQFRRHLPEGSKNGEPRPSKAYVKRRDERGDRLL